MKTSQSFAFYPSDFLLGTALLSAAEVGAYIRLLCYQWQEGALPNDETLLARLGACDVVDIRGILHKFPSGKDGKLRNGRMEEVRKELIAYRLRRSKAGKQGGRPRKALLSPSLSSDEANQKPPSPSPPPSPISTLTESATPPSVDDVLILEPPPPPGERKPKPPPPDPRRQDFLDIFREYFEQGIGRAWAGPDAADNAQLKRLFTRQPDMTPLEWREYLLYINDESQKEYAPTLLQDCGTLALVCSKWDRIKIYSARR
jgi:uncharacterized protein YdaU (DUF1376 family)